MNQPEHEFVELLITVEKGDVVACEHFSEGKQVEPIAEPMVMRVMGEGAYGRVERKIIRLLDRLK